MNSANKGSQLLLATTAHKLIEAGHTPVVSVRDVNAANRREFGTRGYVSVEKLGAFRSGGLNLLPAAVSSRLPVAGDASFDYVLDASGFSLTDSWGMAPIASRLSRLARWKRRGIGLTMLPQAFGPFTRPEVASGVRDVLAYADAVWARDATSADYVKGVVREKSSVTIAPDITIGLSVTPSQIASGHTVIVPNWNLAERSGPGGRERYISSLESIVAGLRKQGRTVIGMSHEGSRDLALIREVADRAGAMDVLDPRSGLDCKEIIAGADLVVAGRYHALVSSLSAGVPVIGHSWSHKYQALMDDFAVSDGLADPFSPEETVGRIAALDLGAERDRLRAVIPGVKARVSAVWDGVNTITSGR